jgi:hypothetical protein
MDSRRQAKRGKCHGFETLRATATRGARNEDGR